MENMVSISLEDYLTIRDSLKEVDGIIEELLKICEEEFLIYSVDVAKVIGRHTDKYTDRIEKINDKINGDK